MEFELIPIDKPKKGDVVLQRIGDIYILVEIISGYLYDPIYNRFSNFWHYYNLENKKIECGYGWFYKIGGK